MLCVSVHLSDGQRINASRFTGEICFAFTSTILTSLLARWHGHRSGHSRPKTTSKKCTKLQDAGYSVGHTIGTGGCVTSVIISCPVSPFQLTLLLPLPSVGRTIGTEGCGTSTQGPSFTFHTSWLTLPLPLPPVGLPRCLL